MTYEDLAKMPQFGVITTYATNVVQNNGSRDYSLQQLRVEIPRAAAQLQDLLSAGQSIQLLDQFVASWDQRKGELISQRAALTNKQPDLRKLIDYADYKLDLNIAPGLTRASLIKLERSAPWEVKVIDYELVKSN